MQAKLLKDNRQFTLNTQWFTTKFLMDDFSTNTLIGLLIHFLRDFGGRSPMMLSSNRSLWQGAVGEEGLEGRNPTLKIHLGSLLVVRLKLSVVY